LLTDLFILRGVPAYIRFDNGPEFIAKAVKNWIKAVWATLREAQIIIERWRKHYNHKRPHSALAGIAPRGPAYKVRREEPREDPRGWVSYPSTSLMTLRMERRSAASSLRSAMASAV